MKLEESDIRAVANNRFWSKVRYLRFFGALFGALILSLVILVLTKSILSALVFVPVFVYLFVEFRAQTLFQRQLVAQWKAEQQ